MQGDYTVIVYLFIPKATETPNTMSSVKHPAVVYLLFMFKCVGTVLLAIFRESVQQKTPRGVKEK